MSTPTIIQPAYFLQDHKGEAIIEIQEIRFSSVVPESYVHAHSINVAMRQLILAPMNTTPTEFYQLKQALNAKRPVYVIQHKQTKLYLSYAEPGAVQWTEHSILAHMFDSMTGGYFAAIAYKLEGVEVLPFLVNAGL